jgi:hypothetical protein
MHAVVVLYTVLYSRWSHDPNCNAMPQNDVIVRVVRVEPWIPGSQPKFLLLQEGIRSMNGSVAKIEGRKD